MCWRKTFLFLKLPNKVQVTFITAKVRQYLYRDIGGGQIELRPFNPSQDYFLHTGNMKKFLVKMLEVGGAYMNRFRHHIHRPVSVGGIVYIHPQSIYNWIITVVLTAGRMTDNKGIQIIEQKTHEAIFHLFLVEGLGVALLYQ